MPMHNLIEYQTVPKQQEVYGFIKNMKQLILIVIFLMMIF